MCRNCSRKRRCSSEIRHSSILKRLSRSEGDSPEAASSSIGSPGSGLSDSESSMRTVKETFTARERCLFPPWACEWDSGFSKFLGCSRLPAERRRHAWVRARIVVTQPACFTRRSGGDEQGNDLVVGLSSSCVLIPPIPPSMHRPAKRRGIERCVSHVKGRTPFQERFYRTHVSTECSPVQAGFLVRPPRLARVGAAIDQVLDDVRVTVLAGPCETVFELGGRRRRLQAAVRIEEGLHQVQPTDAGGGFQIERSTVPGEILGGLRTAVRQTAIDEGVRVAA